MSYWSKLQGGQALPARASKLQIISASTGGLIAIAVLAYLAESLHMPLILGSFGASCVLLFGFPDSPFSQPRNVIAGHFIASLVGLIALSLFGAHWWSMALALSAAIALMLITRTVHPPAGSNPLIIMLTQPHWGFLWIPTLLGAMLLVLIALVFNNLDKTKSYPKYWF
jgi:CBS-domain-containing membrane protein